MENARFTWHTSVTFLNAMKPQYTLLIFVDKLKHRNENQFNCNNNEAYANALGNVFR